MIMNDAPKGVQLGRRWKPGPVERRDSETGFYEAVNPHALSSADILTQRALLAKVDTEAAARIEQARTAKHAGSAA